ncbi:hypothetical protein [Actinomadura chibensis]|uniref:Uncharacterized protein n=1 Tax=Actinomadura chibensis TaxID=392828 RepID=A0A5D0NN35_9ACTN|nr:hypothetical protein [Actinomadura chibensis]TYB45544.1 hypothetical protein FXF69_19140 [Actinomadura chibensis]
MAAVSGRPRRRRARELTSHNPFWLPRYSDLPPRVLCPLIDGNHANYYVKLKSAEAEYERFKERMAINPSDLPRRGHLVLVRGGEGAGKSALLNRCAHWLVENSQETPPKIYHAHLLENDIDDRGQLDHALRIAKKLYGLVQLELDEAAVSRLAPLFRDLEERRPADPVHRPERGAPRFGEPPEPPPRPLRETDIIDVLQFLGRVIQGMGACLLLVLPPAKSLAEVESYLRLVQPSLILMTELDVVHGEDAPRNDSDAALVELWLEDSLSDDDIQEFLRDRLRRAERRGAVHPPVSMETLRPLRRTVGDHITIFLLQNFLATVLELALQRNAPEVGDDDFNTFLSAGMGSP